MAAKEDKPLSFHRRLAESGNLTKAVSLVNEDLLHCVSEGQFVTACVGIWNAKGQTWTYCGAGHPGGVLLQQDHVTHLPHTGPLLGVMTEAEWSCRTIRLQKGDRLFLYTDGVIEAGLPENKLAQEGLEAIIRQSSNTSLKDQLRRIVDEVSARNAGHPEDDATVLAVEIQ